MQTLSHHPHPLSQEPRVGHGHVFYIMILMHGKDRKPFDKMKKVRGDKSGEARVEAMENSLNIKTVFMTSAPWFCSSTDQSKGSIISS